MRKKLFGILSLSILIFMTPIWGKEVNNRIFRDYASGGIPLVVNNQDFLPIYGVYKKGETAWRSGRNGKIAATYCCPCFSLYELLCLPCKTLCLPCTKADYDCGKEWLHIVHILWGGNLKYSHFKELVEKFYKKDSKNGNLMEESISQEFVLNYFEKIISEYTEFSNDLRKEYKSLYQGKRKKFPFVEDRDLVSYINYLSENVFQRYQYQDSHMKLHGIKKVKKLVLKYLGDKKVLEDFSIIKNEENIYNDFDLQAKEMFDYYYELYFMRKY